MNRQINHKTMRVVVGIIALLLAPTVYMLSNSQQPLASISNAYWTDSRDVFVGALVAVGFFLFAYNGMGGKKDWEFYLSKAACLFAICIALFPTSKGQNGEPPAWVVTVAHSFQLDPDTIHDIAAVLFFLCLTALMWFFSNRALKKGRPYRAYIYRSISLLMVGGIVTLITIGGLLRWDNTTMLVEVWGLTLFGIGWLLAGVYRTEDNLRGRLSAT